MKKVFIQGIITILFFFGTWFILMKIDWVKILRIQKLTDKTIYELGEQLLNKVFYETENKNTYVLNSVDSIVTKICKANKIDRKTIKVHILNDDNINAFALFNGYLVLYSGLILNSDNQEELIGVICHEIAHIELNHIKKKLIREIGFSVSTSMTIGKGGSEIIEKIEKILFSSAFNRKLEKEADIKAIDYLINVKVNPEAFARFLYKMSDKENVINRYLIWVSTHPHSKERAEYIIENNKNRLIEYKPILSNSTWKKLKEELKHKKNDD